MDIVDKIWQIIFFLIYLAMDYPKTVGVIIITAIAIYKIVTIITMPKKKFNQSHYNKIKHRSHDVAKN